MPYCSVCGSPVEGRFCARCGSPTGMAAPADTPDSEPVAGPPPRPAPEAPPAAPTALSDNAASGLCYVLGLITGLLFLLMEPYSRNRAVRFHAFQSIFLSAAWFAATIAFNSVVAILSAMLGFLRFLYALSPLISLGFIAISIWLAASAFMGRTVVLPVIGQLARKHA